MVITDTNNITLKETKYFKDIMKGRERLTLKDLDNEIIKLFLLKKPNVFKEEWLDSIVNRILNNPEDNSYHLFKLNPIKDLTSEDYLNHQEKNQILKLIVSNKNTGYDTFHKLAEEGDEEVQDEFKLVFQTQVESLLKLLTFSDLNSRILLALSNNKNSIIQQEVLKHPNTEDYIRERILNKNKNNVDFIKEFAKEITMNPKKYSSMELSNEVKKNLNDKLTNILKNDNKFIKELSKNIIKNPELYLELKLNKENLTLIEEEINKINEMDRINKMIREQLGSNDPTIRNNDLKPKENN